jgi:orotidine-5'-phosphate decarboxylase
VIKSRIILALDFSEIDAACQMIRNTQEFVEIYKLGLEFFLSEGQAGVKEIQNSFPEVKIFLDLKLHDIPNTVLNACQSIADLAPSYLTVHASGGAAMISSAVQALPKTAITAVTVLTSLDSQELDAMGIHQAPLDLAVSLAKNSFKNGAQAIVCSPQEVAAIRAELGKDAILITPGVRPQDTELGDQKRVMTPIDAVKAGADYVVIGRPITQSANPAEAAAMIYETLR